MRVTHLTAVAVFYVHMGSYVSLSLVGNTNSFPLQHRRHIIDCSRDVTSKSIRYSGVGVKRSRSWERHSPAHRARAAKEQIAATASPANTFSRVQEVLLDSSFRKALAPMGAAGALLGPNLDNYHSAFGVLSYKNPIELELGGHVLVTTDWWVPPLFAVAGAGIGALYIVLDAAFETSDHQRTPEWRDVFLGISLFSFQYYLSGLLTTSGCPYWLLAGPLLVIAERMFRKFDSTAAGFWVSLATAVLGPLIEVLLVNTTDLYVYNGADILGVDSWIPIVYFCGGPAVGNLARAVYAQLRAVDEEVVQ